MESILQGMLEIFSEGGSGLCIILCLTDGCPNFALRKRGTKSKGTKSEQNVPGIALCLSLE